MEKTNIKEFSKEDTIIVKGIAIILMLTFHCLAFPNRLPDNLQPISLTKIWGINSSSYIGEFGEICVPIFFFLSGLGMMKKSEVQGNAKSGGTVWN